jgi:uncharacterized OsmC-like protein
MNKYTVEPDIADLVRAQLNDNIRQGSNRSVVSMKGRAVRRFIMQAEVEGHRIVTDEPLHGGGTDLAPAPLRYFVAGIVECALIWCVKVAAVESVEITELSAQAEAFLEAGAVGLDALSSSADVASGRGFDRLALTVSVASDDSPQRVADVVRKGVRACPAAVTYARGAQLILRVVHNDEMLFS